MSSHFIVGAYGWDYAEWTPSFYPEDLPDDWRLTYYSRFFTTVLVPAEHSCELNADRCRALLKDVGETFEFFLEINPEWLADGEFLARWLSETSALNSRLSGFWVSPGLQAEALLRQELVQKINTLAHRAPVYLAADLPLLECTAETPGEIYRYSTPNTAGLIPSSLMVLDATVPLDLRQLGMYLLEFYKQNKSAAKKTVLVTGKPPALALLHQAQSLVALF